MSEISKQFCHSALKRQKPDLNLADLKFKVKKIRFYFNCCDQETEQLIVFEHTVSVSFCFFKLCFGP